MIQLVPQLTILLAVEPVDFRRGIDGLAAVCRNQLGQDPFSGRVFLFRNRSGTSVKLLTFDGSGYWLCQKRFSEGKLQWWPQKEGAKLTPVAAQELQVVLYGGNPVGAQLAASWRRVATQP